MTSRVINSKSLARGGELGGGQGEGAAAAEPQTGGLGDVSDDGVQGYCAGYFQSRALKMAPGATAAPLTRGVGGLHVSPRMGLVPTLWMPACTGPRAPTRGAPTTFGAFRRLFS